MNLFENVRATFGAKAKTSATSSEIIALIDEARRRVAEADSRAARLDGARAEAILVGPDALASLQDEIGAAAQDAANAEAILAFLEGRLEAVEAAEAEDRRKAAYDTAIAKRGAAAKRLRLEYQKLAVGLRDLVKLIAEADVAVERANAVLPLGSAALEGAEALVRDVPGTPRRVVSEKIENLWVVSGGSQPAGNQEAIRAQADGTGTFTYEAGGFRHTVRYERRRFRRIEVVDSLPTRVSDRLAEIRLPGLRADDPDILPGLTWGPSPSTILDALDRLAVEGRAPATEAPAPRVEYQLVVDEAAVE